MTVADIHRKTAEKMGYDPGNRLPCTPCGEATLIATLSNFGARCFACYQAYCRAPRETPERSPAALAIRAEIAALGKGLPL